MFEAAHLRRLQEIMQQLRSEDGCPWDRKQDLHSMRPYLLEECYEVLEAITGPPHRHAEELGDLLFQIVFQSQLQAEQGHFGLSDVVEGICDKLERRHPHVFGDTEVAGPSEVETRWEALKQAEGKGRLDDVPRTLPALMRAEKVGKRVARLGFDWNQVAGPLAKVSEELAELKEAITQQNTAAIEAELGDLLFATVNVARHLSVNPELALDACTERFVKRFKWVEAQLQSRSSDCHRASEEELDALWEEAKRHLREREEH